MQRKIKAVILYAIAITCMVLSLIILDNATPIDDDKYINAANIGEGSLYETISDITLRVPMNSNGANLGGFFMKPEELKGKLFYLEDEKVDENGTLLDGRVYVETQVTSL